MPRHLNLRDLVFSWNIAAAPGYALLVYIFKNMAASDLAPERPASDVGYYFQRSAVRINDSLHLNLVNAVTTNAVARQDQGPWGQFGLELTILISALALVLAVFLAVRLLGRKMANGPALRAVTAFFAAPFCYLLVLKITWRWPSGDVQPHLSDSFWQNPLVIIFAVEAVCAWILFLVSQRHKLPFWAKAVLYAVHFGIWVPVLSMGMPDWIHPPLTPYLLLIGFPLAGAVALFFPARSRSDTSKTRAVGWSLAGFVLSAFMLAAVWWPGWPYDLSHPRDMQSVTSKSREGRAMEGAPAIG
jgi:hypothetical protein